MEEEKLERRERDFENLREAQRREKKTYGGAGASHISLIGFGSL